MWKQGTRRAAARLKRMLRAVTVIRIGVCMACSYGIPGWAAPMLDLETLFSGAPRVAGLSPGLSNGQYTYLLRLDYLRTAAEMNKRIGGISNFRAGRARTPEGDGDAYALALALREMAFGATGTIDPAGSNNGSSNAFLGKAYVHSSGRSPGMPSKQYDLATGPRVIGEAFNPQRRDWRATGATSPPAARAGASLNRASALDGKKCFPDPIMGIRGEAGVLNVPTST
jgi:hypothetical protein